MAAVDWDAGITRAMTVLLGLCVVIVGVGLVLPSSAQPAGATPGYRPMAAPAMPVRLVVPALKIKAPIQPIEVDSHAVLDPPRNPRDVGWWQRSARPGAKQGQTVLTGHTVHTGGGGDGVHVFRRQFHHPWQAGGEGRRTATRSVRPRRRSYPTCWNLA